MQKFSLEEDGFCGAFYKGNKYCEKSIIFMSGAGVGAKMAIEAEHKYPKECEKARKDSVEQILSFLYEW